MIEAPTQGRDTAMIEPHIKGTAFQSVLDDVSNIRMLDLLWAVEGECAPAYLIERGARAAQRILAAGAYADMVETARTAPATRARASSSPSSSVWPAAR